MTRRKAALNNGSRQSVVEARRLVVGLLLCLAVAMPGAKRANALVSPTNYIEHQIQKPNMLVVLDTSGSMNGMPASAWSNANEVGVDCDNGFNCRGWGLTGKCASSGRSCAGDPDCQTATCELGGGSCLSDSDCLNEYACEIGGNTCELDADCAVLGLGTCKASGVACDLNNLCGDSGMCALTKNACSNIGKKCTMGQCKHDKTRLCTKDTECPTTNVGTCSIGASPSGGCTDSSQCPPIGACSTGESCAVAADCPKITVGTCKTGGNTCTKKSECSGSGNKCNIPKNQCNVQSNSCVFPTSKCEKPNSNKCNLTNNGCDLKPNACLLKRTNRCVPSATTDVCVPQPAAGTGTLKMCQSKMNRCTTNADCPAGDICGPPTSRTVVAKRTLQRVLSDNANVVNFGFMTFFQSGYYPYYQITGGTSATEVVFVSDAVLTNSGCVGATGPTTNCKLRGADYTLTSGKNSRYAVDNDGTSFNYDINWCGDVCTIENVGTGRYTGSNYQRTITTGTVSSTKLTLSGYEGKHTVVGGVPYQYYQSNASYYNGGAKPPIGVINCGSQCSATCGARWDTQLSDFIKPEATQQQATDSLGKILEKLEPASYGGIVTYGGTPSGCTLENNVTKTAATSAYHYMSQVKSSDALSCRQNYVLFITDGEANGPGDSDCTKSSCAAADPAAAGCTCRVVLAAYRMRKDLGIKTFAVGFSSDVTVGNARIINDNVARAGGTDFLNDGVAPFAYMATNEQELVASIQGAIYDAVRGTYSTSPSTGSSGTQQTGTIAAGKYALDARVDFPSWKGHLLAYDVTANPPVLAWDTGALLDQRDWRTRRLYLGANDGSVIKVNVDFDSEKIVNKDDIFSIFDLGSNADEAERIIKFIMGDPALKNPARMGSMINSTPIDVAGPGDSPLLGGHEFYVTYKDRPALTYVGADDGMLHAFFTNDTEVAGETMPAGSEAFAFIPPGMLSVAKKLYVQKGQLADPAKHIYGLASSPKVRNLCSANCDDAQDAVWKTLLVMGEGYGGAGMFVLDVTNPVSAGGFADPPVSIRWHSQYGGISSTYTNIMGNATSVPAFYFNKTSSFDDFRLIFTSGYNVTPNSTTQGKYLVVASAASGVVQDYEIATPDNSCTQKHTMLTDVATSRINTAGEYQRLRAGYAGETWGNLWRYSNGSMINLAKFGCEHPLHFSPTVVQLDRDDPNNRPGQTYLVQVTNSALDDDTIKFAPSQLVVMFETTSVEGEPVLDQTYGTLGKKVLRAGVDNEICGETNPDGSCKVSLPAHARPTSTPMALLKKDGSGFQIMSTWYAPDIQGCSKGATWLALHNIKGSEVTQIQGIKIANEPVTSPVIANGRLFVVGSTGAIEITGNLEATISKGQASPKDDVGVGIFNQLNWTEID